MPITYNYEGPLASPAVDSAYRAGQRTSAQQRRSELERLQLARQQMQQNAALQQQRFQQQAMLQQQGQYGDLQRLLLTDQMRQQSQQGQYAQQMAMEEYRNQTQAERDLKYWDQKENFVDYQMNSQGQQESAKIRRQIAEINASGYPDTWKQQAIGQLEAQRMGVTTNPENFTNEEFQPNSWITDPVDGARAFLDSNMRPSEWRKPSLSPAEMQARSFRMPLTDDPNGPHVYFAPNSKGEVEMVKPDFIQGGEAGTSQSDPTNTWIDTLPPEKRAPVYRDRFEDALKLYDMTKVVTTKDEFDVESQSEQRVGITWEEANAMVDLQYNLYEPGTPQYQQATQLQGSAEAKMSAAGSAQPSSAPDDLQPPPDISQLKNERGHVVVPLDMNTEQVKQLIQQADPRTIFIDQKTGLPYRPAPQALPPGVTQNMPQVQAGLL